MRILAGALSEEVFFINHVRKKECYSLEDHWLHICHYSERFRFGKVNSIYIGQVGDRKIASISFAMAHTPDDGVLQLGSFSFFPLCRYTSRTLTISAQGMLPYLGLSNQQSIASRPKYCFAKIANAVAKGILNTAIRAHNSAVSKDRAPA